MTDEHGGRAGPSRPDGIEQRAAIAQIVDAVMGLVRQLPHMSARPLGRPKVRFETGLCIGFDLDGEIGRRMSDAAFERQWADFIVALVRHFGPRATGFVYSYPQVTQFDFPNGPMVAVPRRPFEVVAAEIGATVDEAAEVIVATPDALLRWLTANGGALDRETYYDLLLFDEAALAGVLHLHDGGDQVRAFDVTEVDVAYVRSIAPPGLPVLTYQGSNDALY